METIKDFLDDLKSRVSNPLLSSFLISWLVSNWKISYGLIFYSTHDLFINNYTSHEELVRKNLDCWNSFFLPFLISIIYTFGFPFLREIIKYLHSRIVNYWESKTLEDTKENFISVQKYITIRENYHTLTKQVSEVINDESNNLKENTELKLKNIEFEKENTSLINERAEYIQKTNSEFLIGTWKINFIERLDYTHTTPIPRDDFFRINHLPNIQCGLYPMGMQIHFNSFAPYTTKYTLVLSVNFQKSINSDYHFLLFDKFNPEIGTVNTGFWHTGTSSRVTFQFTKLKNDISPDK